jgi:hypothetical protein
MALAAKIMLQENAGWSLIEFLIASPGADYRNSLEKN